MKVNMLSKFNNSIAFCRYYKNDEEKLKQYELNRNKSMNYVLNAYDKDFFEYVNSERKKGITENYPAGIKKYLYQYCGSPNTDDYDAFNYPRLYRGIGISELNALLRNKQIYSSTRSNSEFGIDVTNVPGGVNYGHYLVKFKLKPNFDLYFASDYGANQKFKNENMPSVEEYGDGSRHSLSRHTILTGTYTLNDVDEITDLKTKKVIYSSSDETIPSVEELLKNTHSSDANIVIKSLEDLQTYTGDGDQFLKQTEFLLKHDNANVREAYINAIYNYGHNDSLPKILIYMKKAKKLSAGEIARIANCIEKFGDKHNHDNDIALLINETLKLINDDEEKEYLFNNIYDAMQAVKYDENNNYKNAKKYLNIDLLPIAIIMLKYLKPDYETDKFVKELLNKVEIKKYDKIYSVLSAYDFLSKYDSDRIYESPFPKGFFATEEDDY